MHERLQRFKKMSREELLDELDLLVNLQQSDMIEQMLRHVSGIERMLTVLGTVQGQIMSAISDFAAKQKAFNDQQDAAITGLQGDVDSLNAKILELQNTPGAITAEDQALLDELEAHGNAITQKLQALDALTPPVAPPA